MDHNQQRRKIIISRLRAGRQGFTMFFAVLVAGLTLAIGAAIYDLVSRQLSLSQTVAESQYAIYMADTGAECAMYWDYKCTLASCTCLQSDPVSGNCTIGTAFATSTTSVPPSSNVLCNSFDIAKFGTPPNPFTPQPPPSGPANGWTVWTDASAATAATTTFTFMMPTVDSVNGVTINRCARVTVAKYFNTAWRTIITSDGFSTCDQNSPNLVERELRINY